MKKLLTFLCALTCVLSLTACGSEREYSDFEKGKAEQCVSLSSMILDLAMAYGTDADIVSEITSTYNKQEMAYYYEYLMSSTYGVASEADFGTFEGLLTTSVQAIKQMDGIVSVGQGTYEIVGKEIVVTYPITGNKCNGTATLSFTNDIFAKFTEGNVEAKTSFKQKMQEAGSHMGDAALNTVLGMFTVFLMLIIISIIISGFKFLNKEPEKKTVVENSATESEPSEELVDDSELVAVIMAAISAYESANGGSADGFVVRSIKKANRRKF